MEMTQIDQGYLSEALKGLLDVLKKNRSWLWQEFRVYCSAKKNHSSGILIALDIEHRLYS